MAVTTTLLKMQLSLLKGMLNTCDLETARSGQAMLGTLMATAIKNKVLYQTEVFKNFVAQWIVPKKQTDDKVILYIHGGGYVAGDIDYAKGFGTILSYKTNTKVFCVAYRLAPEYKFPCALDDVLESYNFLLNYGYSSNQIILCGESAGGGLIYSLVSKLKEKKIKLPGALIAISPWTDLTFSGKSMDTNKEKDPSLTKERLQYFVDCFIPKEEDAKNHYISPVFSDFTDFPPSLVFVGGDEILLDDSVRLAENLTKANSKVELVVTPGMWHVYILYGVKETKSDFLKIQKFISEITGESK